MSLTISARELRRDLRTVRNATRADSLVLHTDLLRVGLLKGLKDRAALCRAYFEILAETWPRAAFLFPTFNYDFCRTGRYEVDADRCQVGVLNEFVRRQHPGRRTLTPIFNFTILGERAGFSPGPAENVFGPSSTFAEMVSNGATVAFFGAGFDSNTFLHHVEETRDIGYRYHKRFHGVIDSKGGERPIHIVYRVRPLHLPDIGYDWPRLERDLGEKGILCFFPLGRGRMLTFEARKLLAYWGERIKGDELFLLNESSRAITRNLYKRYGPRLTWEVMEGPPCQGPTL